MLSPEIKSQIQVAYSRLLEEKGYKSRHCQRQMIADIANTLGNIVIDSEGARTSDGGVCVVEAGTGTGKTVAYAMAALPIAKALGKRLVIATATVALQEQIVLLDLPDIRKHSGLEFSFALAKGRRRYLCLSRLDLALQAMGSSNHTLALYEDEVLASDVSHQALYEEMMARLGRGDWNGERDSWSTELENDAWLPISTDHVQCTGRKCSHYENCYFYRARERIHKVDCIVSNHDLVLADLMMGGGAVLPAPEDTIYIFDEGHHLPDKAINHFSNFQLLQSTQAWLEQLPSSFGLMAAEIGDVGGLTHGLGRLEAGITGLLEQLQIVSAVIEPLRELAEGEDRERRYRFEQGRADPALMEASAGVLAAVQRLSNQTIQIQGAIDDRMSDEGPGQEQLEYWLPIIASVNARLNGGAGLWQSYLAADPAGQPPTARWVSFRDNAEVAISASPVSVHDTLQALLWARCFGAVLTSATLAEGGDFERFRKRAGIGADNHFRALKSPFDYGTQAVLRVPSMNTDPRDAEAHNAEVASLLPATLAEVAGGLVLFASWRQMFRIRDALPEAFRERLLVQGDLSKSEIIATQKRRVDQGQASIIFGLASFAEGIDLPGRYCEHVVIVKIPFAVPDDPVGATLSEWIEGQGGNAFQEIMIPDAALRMVQACGRLLRTETDQGVVTILDRRLTAQRYGQRLLNALPPFRRELG
ncbi:MAG: ATP-dependent DNA helicase DinG [Candidatus Azotimanducaceae bacterium]|jgi:ATP-dependent DNA helicase DinG